MDDGARTNNTAASLVFTYYATAAAMVESAGRPDRAKLKNSSQFSCCSFQQGWCMTVCK